MQGRNKKWLHLVDHTAEDKRFGAQAGDPPCLGCNSDLSTHWLDDPGEASDPLPSLFLCSQMGTKRVPGASCFTFLCLRFLI